MFVLWRYLERIFYRTIEYENKKSFDIFLMWIHVKKKYLNKISLFWILSYIYKFFFYWFW